MAHLNKNNGSGCPDPTAHEALLPILNEEEALEKKTKYLIKTIKSMIDLNGYDLVDRIIIRDRKTGKTFR